MVSLRPTYRRSVVVEVLSRTTQRASGVEATFGHQALLGRSSLYLAEAVTETNPTRQPPGPKGLWKFGPAYPLWEGRNPHPASALGRLTAPSARRLGESPITGPDPLQRLFGFRRAVLPLLIRWERRNGFQKCSAPEMPFQRTGVISAIAVTKRGSGLWIL